VSHLPSEVQEQTVDKIAGALMVCILCEQGPQRNKRLLRFALSSQYERQVIQMLGVGTTVTRS
jgi:hypothetical protein